MFMQLMNNIVNLNCLDTLLVLMNDGMCHTVKPVLSGHSKIMHLLYLR